MIRLGWCPHCQINSNQRIIKSLTTVTTTCLKCSTTLSREYTPRKPLRAVSKEQLRRITTLGKIPPPPDGKCQECHQPPDWRGLEKHHIVFRSHGGSDDTSNLIFLCGKCHAAKHGIHEVTVTHTPIYLNKI